MNQKLLVLIAWLAMASTTCFSQGWKWTRGAGGFGTELAQSVVADQWGNVYVAGEFNSDTMYFGNTYIMQEGAGNIFLAKYNASGALIWVKRFGGEFEDGASCLAIDTNNNVYLTGFFHSPTLIFDTITLTNTFVTVIDASSGTEDIFIAKLDTSGKAIWAKNFGGSSDDKANSVAVNNAGEVFVTGSYRSDTMIIAGTLLINSGGDDMFLVKLDSMGSVVWALRQGGTTNDGGFSLALDNAGGVYVAGNFMSPTITFGTTTLTNASTVNDLFIVKYSNTGSIVWAKGAGGNNDDFATSVATDKIGNVYLTGSYSSPTIVFDGDTLKNSTNIGNMFLVRYSSSGVINWAKSTNIHDMVFPQFVTTDSVGNIYVTGYFGSATATFGTIALTNISGNTDVFLAKYNNAGNAVWAKAAGGQGNDEAYCATIDATGNIYVVGEFDSPTILFGYAEDTNFFAGENDIFLTKFNESSIYVPIIDKNNQQIVVYPNPATGSLHLLLNNGGYKHISIYDCMGKSVFSLPLIGNETSLPVDLQNYKAGVYFLIATDENGGTKQVKLIINP